MENLEHRIFYTAEIGTPKLPRYEIGKHQQRNRKELKLKNRFHDHLDWEWNRDCSLGVVCGG